MFAKMILALVLSFDELLSQNLHRREVDRRLPRRSLNPNSETASELMHQEN
jgi:hypothetical protein